LINLLEFKQFFVCLIQENIEYMFRCGW